MYERYLRRFRGLQFIDFYVPLWIISFNKILSKLEMMNQLSWVHSCNKEHWREMMNLMFIWYVKPLVIWSLKVSCCGDSRGTATVPLLSGSDRSDLDCSENWPTSLYKRDGFWICGLLFPSDFFPYPRRLKYGLTPSPIFPLRRFAKHSYSIYRLLFYV